MFRVNPITPTMLVHYILDAPEVQFAKQLFIRVLSTVVIKGKNLPNMTNMDLMKSVWIFSHFACACGFLTSLWINTELWYYVSIGGAISTYSVASLRHMVVMAQGALILHDEIPLAFFLNAENTLLLVTALIHVTSKPNILKMFSFAIFSYMNLISYILHELIPANAFTTALYPILGCIEPTLLGVACFTDYSVQFLYYKEYYDSQTSILYGFIFSYITFKRLEKSDLARISLYSMFDMINTTLMRVHAPKFLVRWLRKYRNAVHFMVPLDIADNSNDMTRKTSVKTRATSIFFEPILIINDLN